MRHTFLLIILLFVIARSAQAQLDFEQEPINYSATQPTDRIARLTTDLESGTVKLDRDESRGYLKSLLEHLEIPVSSQVLVFSKTSFQRHRISRRTPRALYFNDDVYVGWVQSGDVIEISSTDRELGAVFYTLDQSPQGGRPQIVRQTGHCTICHASTHTGRVPGHILRSVYADRGGMPVLASGTFRTDHTSPLRERWGGWYVTGTHGRQRHMGNETVASRSRPEELDREAGANLTKLTTRIDTKPYLSPHSDLVAHMVLAHQVGAHNGITAANFSTRRALHDAAIMRELIDDDTVPEPESINRRIQSAADRLVEWLLMMNEAGLTDSIAGTTDFAGEFGSRGPRDKSGRSLRELDLKSRLFRYPCSFLIYSEAFDALPDRLRDAVYRKLWDVLTGKNAGEKFAHLSTNDRSAVREILSETKPGLPAYWTGNHEAER